MNFDKSSMVSRSVLPTGLERDIYILMGDVVATAHYTPPNTYADYQVGVWNYHKNEIIKNVHGNFKSWREMEGGA